MATEMEMMHDLHTLREQLYEKTKHMTPEERAAYVRKEVDNGLVGLGVTLRHVVGREEFATA